MNIPEDYQWMLSIFLPLVRAMNGWILTKVCCKVVESDDYTVKISCLQDVGTRYALFLSVTLGTVATETTTYIILAEDFLINIYLCIKSIYRLRFAKKTFSFEEEKGDIKVLVLNERIEFVVPLAYSVCFITAYYGPNAELIGNVKFSS